MINKKHDLINKQIQNDPNMFITQINSCQSIQNYDYINKALYIGYSTNGEIKYSSMNNVKLTENDEVYTYTCSTYENGIEENDIFFSDILNNATENDYIVLKNDEEWYDVYKLEKLTNLYSTLANKNIYANSEKFLPIQYLPRQAVVIDNKYTYSGVINNKNNFENVKAAMNGKKAICLR